MRSKKAKALRQYLRTEGVNPAATDYGVKWYQRIVAPARIDAFGTEVPPWIIQVHTVRLKPECGRAQYQQLKKAAP